MAPMPTIATTQGTWKYWNQIYATNWASTTGSSTIVEALAEMTTSWTTAATSPTLPVSKIWTSWNRAYTTTTLTDCGITSGQSGTAVSVTVDPWPSWNSTYTVTSPWSSGGNARPARVYTPEEITARERRSVVERERQIQVEGERALARGRAQVMLRENLNEVQREELTAKGHFTITVHEGDARRIYRIKTGRSGNVQQVDDNGRVLKTLCAHPSIACPDEDTMLAQKLWLESREQEFLRIANHS